MPKFVIPSSIATPFAHTEGEFTAVYSKPNGASVATVFVASQGSASRLATISKSPATASFVNGVLHVNLGSSAAARSAAGIAAESPVISRDLGINE